MLPRHVGLTLSSFPPGNVQAVTFNSQIASAQGTFTPYAVPRARQRKLTKDEQAIASGLTARRTATWELWQDVLTLASAPAPKIGDRIVDASSLTWVILRVEIDLDVQVYACLCQVAVP